MKTAPDEWPHTRCGFNRSMQHLNSNCRERGMLKMKQRPRIYYTDAQKELMWGRWQQGDSMHTIARLFDRQVAQVAVRIHIIRLYFVCAFDMRYG